ncbi:MAG: GNAT family N-acetyltransferase [Ktedonobacterales bacterium]|nr:GNAT family N-acetyltransferase [Ktedonobacterales bacterium]
METLVCVPANTYSIAALATLFNRAFAGYAVPMRQTAVSLRTLIATNDIRLESSLVIRSANGASAGLSLLALRGERAWIAGMGIAPVWRGHGHGAALLRAQLRRAWEAGARHVRLEVLAENTPARRLYARTGFHDIRRLIVYSGPVTFPPATRRAIGEAPPCVPLSVAEALQHYLPCHQTSAPWQCEPASLARMAETLSALAVSDTQGGVRAYLLTLKSPIGASVLDCGACAAHLQEREHDTLQLLWHVTRAAPHALVRAINVPPGDALDRALATLRCPVVASQWEMALDLTAPPAG